MNHSKTLPLKDHSLLKPQAYIAGKWLGADNQKTIAVKNPANGQVISEIPHMGQGETKRAIEAAHAAWPVWRAKSAKERSQILRKWYDLILQNQEDLALIMTAEQGKPLVESRSEVAYGASFIEWFAEEGKRVYGDVIPHSQSDKRIVVLKQPVGVVAAITPWNFPNAMITRKCGPALAAGCTIVIKPATQTPLSAFALVVLAERAGFPAGVINIVTGSAQEIGKELTTNPLVRKVSFTGSTEVGKILMQQCAGTVKKLSLELGGNAPFIVFDDADIDAAVEGAIASKFRNAGQTCVCANRLLVQDKIYDSFAKKLTEAVTKLKIGNGAESGVQQGPLIDMKAIAKIEQHIEDALKKGAKLIAGGKKHTLGHSFFEPTVMTGVTGAMLVAHEETFGPLAPLFRFKTEQEAIQLANATEYGLAGYFYSRDLARVWRVAEALECGIVGINTGIISTEVAPFGGIKESGMGREGSKYGIEDFIEIKYLCIGGIHPV
ncbi:MAG: NAD-dependent succinate-semialdehyde dehydrogenase [Rhodospirillaceae bacterium]|nr:NAD-dependent succinate-semialdehyde dehydrogenase [Rhodospirillaceae bacterium]